MSNFKLLTLMKCDGCPLRAPESYGSIWCPAGQHCNITYDYQRVIQAMLSGEFDCQHCRFKGAHYKECSGRKFCSDWQPKEDGHE